ncbi:MAG: hypothetical protein E2586_02015 [Novosphingobium sp.]|uniref:hypothetical protein n=1 Tax=Novosphingobium sp. TaxID=1874826 RepID=UPI0012CF469C|nr:hypothetical protein [Novosphingobium sp.]MPS67259.1 hypothetical protein [Novosphingobium sp.]
MNDAITPDLEQAIKDNYRLWNEGKREELDALFRSLAPHGFTIEYVGSSAVDGPTAMAAIWKEYGGKCTTELLDVIVNGTEGAAYVSNHLQTDSGIVSLTSLETYKVAGGRLAIRYFHRTDR